MPDFWKDDAFKKLLAQPKTAKKPGSVSKAALPYAPPVKDSLDTALTLRANNDKYNRLLVPGSKVAKAPAVLPPPPAMPAQSPLDLRNLGVAGAAGALRQAELRPPSPFAPFGTYEDTELGATVVKEPDPFAAVLNRPPAKPGPTISGYDFGLGEWMGLVQQFWNQESKGVSLFNERMTGGQPGLALAGVTRPIGEYWVNLFSKGEQSKRVWGVEVDEASGMTRVVPRDIREPSVAAKVFSASWMYPKGKFGKWRQDYPALDLFAGSLFFLKKILDTGWNITVNGFWPSLVWRDAPYLTPYRAWRSNLEYLATQYPAGNKWGKTGVNTSLHTLATPREELITPGRMIVMTFQDMWKPYLAAMSAAQYSYEEELVPAWQKLLSSGAAVRQSKTDFNRNFAAMTSGMDPWSEEYLRASSMAWKSAAATNRFDPRIAQGVGKMTESVLAPMFSAGGPNPHDDQVAYADAVRGVDRRSVQRAAEGYTDGLKVLMAGLSGQFVTSTGIDPGYSYTWSIDPAAEQAFYRERDLVEAQLGRSLTPGEQFRLKMGFEDPAIEMLGESILDLSWAVPQKVWDTLFHVAMLPLRGAVKLGWRGARAAGLGSFVDWIGRETTLSTARRFSFRAATVFSVIGQNVDDVDGMIMATERYVEGSFKSIPAVGQLQIRMGAELADIVDMNQWATMVDNSIEEVTEIIQKQALDAGKSPAEAIRLRPTKVQVVMEVADKFQAAYLRQVEEKLGTRVETVLATKISPAWDTFRGAWIESVLAARPAWTAINAMDTWFRALLNGTDPLMSVDEILATTNIPRSFFERFPVVEAKGEMALGGKMPKSGPFGFMWQRHHKGSVFSEMPWPIGNQGWSRFPKAYAENHPMVTALADAVGWKHWGVRARETLNFGNWAAGWKMYNTQLEFAVSVRLYATRYWRNYNALSKLGAASLVDVIDDPVMRGLAGMIWNLSGDNPAVLENLAAEALLGEGIRGRPFATLFGGSDLNRMFSNFTPEQREVLRMKLYQGMRDRIKTDRGLTADSAAEVIRSLRDDFVAEWAAKNKSVNADDYVRGKGTVEPAAGPPAAAGLTDIGGGEIEHVAYQSQMDLDELRSTLRSRYPHWTDEDIEGVVAEATKREAQAAPNNPNAHNVARSYADAWAEKVEERKQKLAADVHPQTAPEPASWPEPEPPRAPIDPGTPVRISTQEGVVEYTYEEAVKRRDDITRWLDEGGLEGLPDTEAALADDELRQLNNALGAQTVAPPASAIPPTAVPGLPKNFVLGGAGNTADEVAAWTMDEVIAATKAQIRQTAHELAANPANADLLEPRLAALQDKVDWLTSRADELGIPWDPARHLDDVRLSDPRLGYENKRIYYLFMDREDNLRVGFADAAQGLLERGNRTTGSIHFVDAATNEKVWTDLYRVGPVTDPAAPLPVLTPRTTTRPPARPEVASPVDSLVDQGMSEVDATKAVAREEADAIRGPSDAPISEADQAGKVTTDYGDRAVEGPKPKPVRDPMTREGRQKILDDLDEEIEAIEKTKSEEAQEAYRKGKEARAAMAALQEETSKHAIGFEASPEYWTLWDDLSRMREALNKFRATVYPGPASKHSAPTAWKKYYLWSQVVYENQLAYTNEMLAALKDGRARFYRRMSPDEFLQKIGGMDLVYDERGILISWTDRSGTFRKTPYRVRKGLDELQAAMVGPNAPTGTKMTEPFFGRPAPPIPPAAAAPPPPAAPAPPPAPPPAAAPSPAAAAPPPAAAPAPPPAPPAAAPAPPPGGPPQAAPQARPPSPPARTEARPGAGFDDDIPVAEITTDPRFQPRSSSGQTMQVDPQRVEVMGDNWDWTLYDKIKVNRIGQDAADYGKGFEPGQYLVLNGHHRFAAAQRANLQSLPVVVYDLPFADAMRVAQLSNVISAEMTPWEKGSMLLARLKDGDTETDLARAMYQDPNKAGLVAKYISLTDLSPAVGRQVGVLPWFTDDHGFVLAKAVKKFDINPEFQQQIVTKYMAEYQPSMQQLKQFLETFGPKVQRSVQLGLFAMDESWLSEFAKAQQSVKALKSKQTTATRVLNDPELAKQMGVNDETLKTIVNDLKDQQAEIRRLSGLDPVKPSQVQDVDVAKVATAPDEAEAALRQQASDRRVEQETRHATEPDAGFVEVAPPEPPKPVDSAPSVAASRPAGVGGVGPESDVLRPQGRPVPSGSTPANAGGGIAPAVRSSDGIAAISSDYLPNPGDYVTPAYLSEARKRAVSAQARRGLKGAEAEEKAIAFFEHQVDNANRALTAFDSRKAFFVGDAPGTGKTYTGALITDQMIERGAKRILLVAPSDTLLAQWADVYEQLGITVRIFKQKGGIPAVAEIPGKRGTVWATTYSSMNHWAGGNGQGLSKMIGDQNLDFLILDEAQALKNAYSGVNTALAGIELQRSANKVLFTSATGMESPLHYAYMADALGISTFDEAMQALDIYSEMVTKEFGNRRVEKREWRGVTPRKLAELNEMLIENGAYIRHEMGYLGNYNKMTGELLQAYVASVPVPVQGNYAQMYDDFNQLVRELKKAYRRDANAIMTLEAQRVGVGRSILEQMKVDQAADIARAKLAEGESVAIFTWRREGTEIEDLERALIDYRSGKRKITERSVMPTLAQAMIDRNIAFTGPVARLLEQFPDAAVITGAVAGAERERMIKLFQTGKSRVAIITTGAGGVGLSLHDIIGQFPRTQIILTMPYSAMSMDQVAGRCFRMGSQSNAQIYWLYADAPMEAKYVGQTLRRSQDMGALIGGPEKVADDAAMIDFNFAIEGEGKQMDWLPTSIGVPDPLAPQHYDYAQWTTPPWKRPDWKPQYRPDFQDAKPTGLPPEQPVIVPPPAAPGGLTPEGGIVFGKAQIDISKLQENLDAGMPMAEAREAARVAPETAIPGAVQDVPVEGEIKWTPSAKSGDQYGSYRGRQVIRKSPKPGGAGYLQIGDGRGAIVADKFEDDVQAMRAIDRMIGGKAPVVESYFGLDEEVRAAWQAKVRADKRLREAQATNALGSTLQDLNSDAKAAGMRLSAVLKQQGMTADEMRSLMARSVQVGDVVEIRDPLATVSTGVGGGLWQEGTVVQLTDDLIVVEATGKRLSFSRDDVHVRSIYRAEVARPGAVAEAAVEQVAIPPEPSPIPGPHPTIVKTPAGDQFDMFGQSIPADAGPDLHLSEDQVWRWQAEAKRAGWKDKYKELADDPAALYRELRKDRDNIVRALKNAGVSDAAAAQQASETVDAVLLKIESIVGDIRKTTWTQGGIFGAGLIPFTVPDWMKPRGRRTINEANERMLAQFHEAMSAFDELELSVRVSPATVKLTEEQRQILTDWALRARQAKAEIRDVANGGGEYLGMKMRGAEPEALEIALDYSKETNLDAVMRVLVPFWKFPARSIPFWIKAVATHPEILAFWIKYNQMSNRYAIQNRAINSKGIPLPRLEGFIPIAGSDLWWNPLAPLSVRYALPDEDIDFGDEPEWTPLQQVTNHVYKAVQDLSFGMAPWTMEVLYRTGLIDENRFPRKSLFPFTDLVPPWTQRALIQAARKVGFPVARDMWTPEVGWKDFLVERQVLMDCVESVTNAPDHEKLPLSLACREAIEQRGENQLYRDARQKVEASEYWPRVAGFFTGFYAKPFTDAEAELYRVRNQSNFLYDMINDEVGAEIFKQKPDPQAREQDYYGYRYDTAEGNIYGSYGIIGWTRTPTEGQLNGEERRGYIAKQFEIDKHSDAKFAAQEKARMEAELALGALPIGTPWDIKEAIFAKWNTANSIADMQYPMARTPWTSAGAKSQETLTEHLYDLWWAAIKGTRPRYDPDNETYVEYKKRLTQWEKDLPNIAETAMAPFMREIAIVPKPTAIPNLVDMTTTENLRKWDMANDTILDAMDRVWEERYWAQYWNSVEGLDGYERDLADMKFKMQWPYAPTEDTIVRWVIAEYGNKWTEQQIRAEYKRGNGALTVGERLAVGDTEFDKQADHVFNWLAWVGPSKKALRQAIEDQGGDPGWIDMWYGTGGKPQAWREEEWAAFYSAMASAAATLNLKQPSVATLEEWTVVQKINDEYTTTAETMFGENIWNISGIYSGLPMSKRSQYRAEHPELPAFWDFREVWAAEHPLWAKYYMAEGAKTSSGGGGGGGYGGGSRSTGGSSTAAAKATVGYAGMGPPAAERSTLDVRQLMAPGKLGRGRYGKLASWPTGLMKKVQPATAASVAKSLKDDTPVSPSAFTDLAVAAKGNQTYMQFVASLKGAEREQELFEQVWKEAHPEEGIKRKGIVPVKTMVKGKFGP